MARVRVIALNRVIARVGVISGPCGQSPPLLQSFLLAYLATMLVRQGEGLGLGTPGNNAQPPQPQTLPSPWL